MSLLWVLILFTAPSTGPWLHAAQGVWFGGIFYLGCILLPLLKQDAMGMMLVARLRQWALPLVETWGVVLVSGLFVAETTVRNQEQLLSHPYGRAALVMVILIVLLFALGAALQFMLLPKLVRLQAAAQAM